MFTFWQEIVTFGRTFFIDQNLKSAVSIEHYLKLIPLWFRFRLGRCLVVALVPPAEKFCFGALLSRVELLSDLLVRRQGRGSGLLRGHGMVLKIR